MPYLLLEWQPRASAPRPVRQVLSVVDHNSARLVDVVAPRGWPERGLVGEDGADAAWLILQHAGSAVTTIGSADNHAFRRACIPLLADAVHTGDVHPRHLAHVVDGVAWIAGEPPVYAVLHRLLDRRRPTRVRRPSRPCSSGLVADRHRTLPGRRRRGPTAAR
jgi:hypothetical protein